MNSKRFAKRMKDSGVSPVIATILMVAITVVLAAVLYVMVSGFTHAPPASQTAGLSESQSGNGYTVAVSSVSANNIKLTNLKIVISGAGVTGFDGSLTWANSTGATNNISVSGTGYVTIVVSVLNGNSNVYLGTGDSFTLTASSATVASDLSGATLTLYNGNSNLGSTTL
ncbi:MAG: type IV pilin N-terminal domain-containing protein [Methanomassiliicoccales archaeon]|nr:type IV pilin N-terminal domain-containing protein [Methanomassiliicoccales archaeon]